MQTRFGIKNFRVFDGQGVTFRLAPITMLTGCNSSGKSSIAKAILMLNAFLKKVKKALDNGTKIDLENYQIDFTQYPLSLLGRFDKVLHYDAQAQKIVFEYSIFSNILSKEITVQFVFTSDAGDAMNNAFLEKLTLFYDGEEHSLDLNDTNLVREMLCPSWVGNVEYVSSSRGEVKRLYSLDETSDFSHLLYRYFEKKRLYAQKSNYVLNTFFNHWVQRFGIGQSISLDVDKEGVGVQLRLHNASNDEGVLLADQGYGITQITSILLQIEIAILESQRATIIIEEPEIHLHPKYQSLLADMFVDAHKKYGIEFIIETHSEYIIRKLQLLVATGVIERNSAALLYVYNANEKPADEPLIKNIGIRKDGMLDGLFGKGFFDEADMLTMDLLSTRNQSDEEADIL